MMKHFTVCMLASLASLAYADQPVHCKSLFFNLSTPSPFHTPSSPISFITPSMEYFAILTNPSLAISPMP